MLAKASNVGLQPEYNKGYLLSESDEYIKL